jgi:hypothetical protein
MAGIFRKIECEDGTSPEDIQFSSDNRSVPEKTTSETKRINQQQFNALIRQLSLSKDKT